MVALEVGVSPIEFEGAEEGVAENESFLVKDGEGDGGPVKFFLAHFLELEVELLVEDRVVGVISNLR